MKNYDSLNEALDDLRTRGYEADFDFGKQSFCLYCEDLEMTLDPEDFHVDEVYRFHRNSRSDKNAILFAITSSSGVRGVLVDEFAVNLDPFY
jgi:hypothetical protein